MKIHYGTTARLLTVAVIIVVVQLVSLQVRATLEPGEIAMPDWSLEELPMELGDWRGEPTELDERIFRQIGADAVADRAYHDRAGNVVTAHTALFQDFDEGIGIHYPANCYRTAGWHRLDFEKRELKVPGAPPLPVEISTWEREGQRVKVLYWYSLGEHTIFGRWDLGQARLALRGRAVWPPMVKVMMQTAADRSGQESDIRLLDVGGHVYQWLHDRGIGPGHEPTHSEEEDDSAPD